MALIGQDKFAEAEPLCRETLERRKRVLQDRTTPPRSSPKMSWAWCSSARSKLAEGEPYWREALATSRRVLGPAHPETLVVLHNLAGLAAEEKKAR